VGEAAASAGADGRAADAIRQWADDLEREAHALLISSWGAP
jgi:hypothetical protein